MRLPIQRDGGYDHAYSEKGARLEDRGADVTVKIDYMVRLERIPNIRKHTLHDFIARTVRDEAEAIYTDELKSYLGIADDDTRHETVRHSEEEWVLGDVHTNGIEGVWSLYMALALRFGESRPLCRESALRRELVRAVLPDGHCGRVRGRLRHLRIAR